MLIDAFRSSRSYAIALIASPIGSNMPNNRTKAHTIDLGGNKDLARDVVTVLTGGLNLFVAETTKFQLNLNWIDDQRSKIQREILAQAQVGF